MNEDNKMAGGRCLRRSIFTPRDHVRVMVATYEQYMHRATFWETVIAGEYGDDDGGVVITTHDKKSALKLHDAAVELIRLIGLKDFKALRKRVNP
mgnify:CR=1 FL=1